MRDSLILLAAAALASCRSAPSAQPSPVPEGSAASRPTVSLIALSRTHGGPPTVPDYTVLLTASGETFYSGSATIPVPGVYSGRLATGTFQQLASKLTDAGLVPVAPGESLAVAQNCHDEAMLTLSLQTGNGHYRVTSFCARSPEEARLAAPIYNALESVRWQPGMRQLTLVPPN